MPGVVLRLRALESGANGDGPFLRVRDYRRESTAAARAGKAAGAGVRRGSGELLGEVGHHDRGQDRTGPAPLKGENETKKWLGSFKKNAMFFKGNGVAMKAVNAGEIEGAIIYHYYWFGDQAKTGENSKNVALHYFKNQDPGAFVSLSGGGVLASSKHQKEAQAFLKYVTGKDGQAILRDGTSFEYAVGNGAESNPKLVPLSDLQAPKVEPSKLNSQKVTDLMTAAGIL